MATVERDYVWHGGERVALSVATEYGEVWVVAGIRPQDAVTSRLGGGVQRLDGRVEWYGDRATAGTADVPDADLDGLLDSIEEEALDAWWQFFTEVAE